MDITSIKEAFDWFLIRACLSALVALFAALGILKLYSFCSRLKAAAKRYGWPLVTLFIVCSAWATYTAFPTSEEKEQYRQSQSAQSETNSVWAGIYGIDGTITSGGSISVDDSSQAGIASTEADSVQTDTADSSSSDGSDDWAEMGSLTADDFARGFVLTRIGTNEVHDFASPTNAVVCEDWLAHGAAEDWFYLAFEDWAFRLGTNNVEAIRIFSYGEIQSLENSPGNVFAPLRAVLGIVPATNWGLLDETNQPSQFWYRITELNTLLLTWQNVLVDRNTDTPASFQMEIWTNGRFSYRYDLNCLSCEVLSNVVVGAWNKSTGWWQDSIDTDITSLEFHPISVNDVPESDLDGDGLLLEEELFVHFTDPSKADSDNDGLNDSAEITSGTDPWNPDSDGDGLLDGEEITAGSNPLMVDTDGDDLSDWQELWRYGTDPTKTDTDGDGLPDAVEVAGVTDPANADTDDDGLDDSAESEHGTDPLNPDNDGDGAPDGWEVDNDSDPLLTDTDGDGLSDGVEYQLGSSPTHSDTDEDGLPDVEEFRVTKTSPIMSDSDSDGLSDWQEVDIMTVLQSNSWIEVTSLCSTNVFVASENNNPSDSIKTVSLPFVLDIFNTPIDRISIDTNGKIHLIPTNGTEIVESEYYNESPEDVSVNGNDILVAPYWDDLRLWNDAGSRISLGIDEANNRVVVDFINMGIHSYCDPTNCILTLQVVLSDETNSPIRINYQLVSTEMNGEDATIGVFNRRISSRGGKGCQALVWGCNSENCLTNQLSLGFRLGVGTSPVLADTDGDGLDDGAEFEAGTDPLNPDTDGDGLDDGAEIANNANPLKSDTDGDGMPDAWEVRYGLNPNYRYDASTDKDHDGLSNLKEYQIGSSPLLTDTDGDGRTDYVENNYGTSPILADTDGDGLDDKDEYNRGTSGTNADTDNDGLPDGWEVQWNLNPKSSSGVNGGAYDYDNDGLTNAEEYMLGTNPRLSDTDGDGLDDGEEVGCFRKRYVTDNEWASSTNGWSQVAVETDPELKFSYFEFQESLKIASETIYDIVCQWNGLVLVSSDEHYLYDVVDSSPSDLAGYYVSNAALAIAPYWTESLSDCEEASVEVFKQGTGGNVRYAIQYDELDAGSTNTVTFQVVLVFTNGIYKSTEIMYSEETADAVNGMNASIGVQDAVKNSRKSVGYNTYVPLQTSRVMEFIQGTGGDPLNPVVDSDGDGLSDDFETAIGTDPRQPDTDGDGMYDGWEYDNGFDPCVNNDDVTVDNDETNDSDYDTDNDGLTNREEADFGTDPQNDDTDGDGVTDGKEVENSSDPNDATDGGVPASRVPVAFNFGDPSGSHSEKYRLTVTPVKNPDGSSPASGEEQKSFEWVNAEYGECETKTAMLLRGWTYEVRMYHSGTDPEYGSSPDYDYSLTCIPPTCIGVVADDPEGLFGSNSNSGESYEAEGKTAYILVLDGGIVGDYDRKDGFTNDDLSRVYRNKPLRHWINDDDDAGDITKDDRDVPGWPDPSFVSHIRDIYRDIRIPDYYNEKVDGKCDILDFTPVWIDMGRALAQLDRIGKSVELTLSNRDGGVNLVLTSLAKDNVETFLTSDIAGCGKNLSQNLESADTIHITEEETKLPGAFIDAMRGDPDKGIVLLEGRATENAGISTAPLVLRGYQKPRTEDAFPIFEISLPLAVSPVEDMFRWIDERWVCGDTNCVPSRTGEPANYPDSECNDNRHYIFVHGYAVSVQSARGWAAEMFKRLRQSGCNSRFTAVDWRGDDTRGAIGVIGLTDEAPNYYINVEHAFATASRFVDDCAALNGRKIILAHSLGNMLVSSAAKDHGLVYDKYYMLNAAVPMEAYDEDAFSVAMIDHDWRGVTNKVYSSEWWRLFNPEDGRRRFTWRERFSGIANAINCYSRSEDTLGNVEEDDWLAGKLTEGNFWAVQETLKGTKYAEQAPDDWQMNSEGGWGYNDYYATNRNYVTWPNRRMTERFRNRIKKLSRDDIVVHPVFKPFQENWLFTTNAISEELASPILSRILADAIPAVSLAAGANPLVNGIAGNIDYMSYKSGAWPRKDGSWRHSDIKNIAYRFNFKFFKLLIQED